MSQLSVSDNDSSFERIDSSGASSRLNSPMELLDSEDDLKIQKAILEEEILKLKTTIEKLEVELVSKDQEIQKIQEDLKTQEEMTESERHELHQTKLEMGQWQMKWQVVVESSKKLKFENAKMEDTIKYMEKLQEKNLELEAIIEAMEVKLRDNDQKNKKDVKDLENQKTLLKEKIKKLKETIEKLEVELKNSKDQTKPLKDENSKLKEEIKKMQETLNVKIEDNQKIWDLVKQLKKENQMLSKELDSTDQKAQKKREEDLKDQMKALETENLSLKRELDAKDQTNQKTLLELENLTLKLELKDSKTQKDKVSKLEKDIKQIQEKLNSKVQDHQKDNEQLMKTIEKLEIELKDCKDQKVPEQLSILQEINGIWKVVSETKPENLGSNIGEVLKIEADLERATFESFKSNGDFNGMTKVQFYTTTVPAQTLDRFDYVENNQWKTINYNSRFWNVARIIRDGKLVYEYVDEKGDCYERVYERVAEVPNPVLNDQAELEKLKDQVKQLEKENLQLKKELDAKDQKNQEKKEEDLKDQLKVLETENLQLKKDAKDQKDQEDQKTQDHLPILQELNGNWKLISVERAEKKYLGEFMKITASSESIYVSRARQTGDFYRGRLYPLNSRVPGKKSLRVDYVENNQWKTVDNHKDALNSVKSIQDGKLYFEFIDEQGRSYTDVYERVDEIPDPDEEEEVEEPSPTSNKDLDGEAQKPILENITGSWKLVSLTGNEDCRPTLADSMIIKAYSDRIDVDEFLKSGTKLASWTAQIHSKDSSFKEDALLKHYIEGNEWVTLRKDSDKLKRVKTIEDGKLMVEYKGSDWQLLEVYERTFHVSEENSNQNFIPIESFIFGVFIALIAALFLLHINKF